MGKNEVNNGKLCMNDKTTRLLEQLAMWCTLLERLLKWKDEYTNVKTSNKVFIMVIDQHN